MYEKQAQSIAKDLEKVLVEMSGLDIHQTMIKTEQRPDAQYALTYSIKFKQLNGNIEGAIYFSFCDVEVTNSVAMAIASRNGALQEAEFRNDYLCEFMNTAIGKALKNWEEMGFSTTFEAPRISENCGINRRVFGCETAIIVMALDVSHIFFKVDFFDTSYDVLEGKRILVVDDSVMIQQMLVRKLAKLRFNIETAGDGQQAIEKSRSFKPDLIIMDQVMPVLNGLDAMAKIKKHSPSMKFIMLSSSSQQEELHAAEALGATAYLTKPVNLVKLYFEIARSLITVN